MVGVNNILDSIFPKNIVDIIADFHYNDKIAYGWREISFRRSRNILINCVMHHVHIVEIINDINKTECVQLHPSITKIYSAQQNTMFGDSSFNMNLHILINNNKNGLHERVRASHKEYGSTLFDDFNTG